MRRCAGHVPPCHQHDGSWDEAAALSQKEWLVPVHHCSARDKKKHIILCIITLPGHWWFLPGSYDRQPIFNHFIFINKKRRGISLTVFKDLGWGGGAGPSGDSRPLHAVPVWLIETTIFRNFFSIPVPSCTVSRNIYLRTEHKGVWYLVYDLVHIDTSLTPVTSIFCHRPGSHLQNQKIVQKEIKKINTEKCT